MSANRRNFLKTLGALSLTVLGRRSEASVPAPPPARRLLLNRFSIAGFQYYDGPALVRREYGPQKPGNRQGFQYSYGPVPACRTKPVEAVISGTGPAGGNAKGLPSRSGLPPGSKMCRGCPLNLLVEPDNPHDPFAVAIYLCETKLGYVPRSDNKHISRLLDQEAKLECTIIEVDPDAWVWNMVRVEVWMILQGWNLPHENGGKPL